MGVSVAWKQAPMVWTALYCVETTGRNFAVSWSEHNQRMRLVRRVLAEVERSREPVVPASLMAEAIATFGTEGDFLFMLHYVWFNTVSARLDAVLEAGPDELASATEQVWLDLAEEWPALSSLLAANAGHPALESAWRADQDRLWWAPGVDVASLAARGPGSTRDAAADRRRCPSRGDSTPSTSSRGVA